MAPAAGAKDPLAQTLHLVKAPTARENFPTAQGAHVDAPLDPLKVPLLQKSHALDPATDDVPALHRPHALAAVKEKVPAAQRLQPDWPVVAE